jgi:protein TonB
MKAFSSVASITVHVGVVVAVLFGTAKPGRSDPVRPIERQIFFQPAAPVTGGDAGGLTLPGPVTVAPPDLGRISFSMTLPKTGGLMPLFSPIYSGGVPSPGTGQPGGVGDLLTNEHADVLSGPLPVYPDLLRQAGIEGKVVLEAVVDTTGRVLSQSIAVVAASNPGFIAPARQALLATLFRPAMVGGKPVRMLVRIPYEFAIRSGTGHAR